MIKKFDLDTRGDFYRVKRNIHGEYQKLTRVALEKLINEAVKDRVGNCISQSIREGYEQINEEIKYSYKVFLTHREPSFLRETEYVDKQHGYILVVEYREYIVILKKYASSISKVTLQFLEEIFIDEKFNKFINKESEMRYLNFTNTRVGIGVISKRKYDGESDLTSSVQLPYSNLYVPSSMNFVTKGNLYGLNSSRSSIKQIGKKCTIEEYLNWVVDICNLLSENSNEEELYTDRFARIEKLEKIYPNRKVDEDSVLPNFLVISKQFLIQDLISAKYIYKVEPSSDSEVNDSNLISRTEFETVLDGIEQYTELIPEKNFDTFVSKDNLNDYRIEIVNNKFVFFSDSLKHYHISESDYNNACSLVRYINDYYLLLRFTDPNYIYLEKKLVYTRILKQSWSFYNKSLKNYPELNSLYKSEKGINELTKESTQFPESSLFSFIENYITRDDNIVVCDDLGRETADYISINESENVIRFIHAKYHKMENTSKKSLGASPFHDITSQALKNMGFVNSVEELETLNKVDFWNKSYIANKTETQICRTRKGSANDFFEIARGITNNPNHTKEIWIVVNHLSKVEFEKSINDLSNDVIIAPYFQQLVWELGSLISAGAENNVRVYITTSDPQKII